MKKLVQFTPFAKTDIEQSIPARFREQARAHPLRLAVKTPTKSYTYGALNAEQKKIAQAILEVRGETEEPVILLLQQSVELIAAILGALSAGKLYVPLDAQASPGSLRPLVADCVPGLIITDDATLACARLLANPSCSVINVNAMPASGREIAEPWLSPDRGAYIYYTSGSTGEPKGVVDTHRNVLHNIMRYTNTLRITANDRLSLLQSVHFSGSVSNVFGALLNGGAVFPIEIRKLLDADLGDWVNRENLSIFHSVPSIFSRLVASGSTFPSLRIVRLEGDQATRRNIELFQRYFDETCYLVNGLGATETGLTRQFFTTKDTQLPDGTVPVGYQVEDMEIVVVDSDGKPVKPGTVGEIMVRSKYLASGYWQRPDLTAAAFARVPGENDQRGYFSGDLGVLAKDGCLSFLGRKGFEARLRGQRIDVAAMEDILRQFDSIDDAVVIVREDRADTQQLVAYLEVAKNRSLPAVGELRQVLLTHFHDQPIPSRYIEVARLPTGINGKLDRRALPHPGSARPNLGETYVAANTSLEKMVAVCFSRVLGISPIGINDIFSELGGESLQVLEVASLLEQRLAVHLPSEIFFEILTVAKVVEHIGLERSGENIVELKGGDGGAPMFLCHNYSGLVLEYRQLAHALEGDSPVLGLQFNGRPEAYISSANLAELAAHYLQEIQRVQPHGPYRIGGQCFGGLLAFEISRQLRERGETIEVLALIDTAYPHGRLDRLAYHFSPIRQIERMSTMTMSEALRDLRARVLSGGRFALGAVLRLANRIIGTSLPRFAQRPTDIHRLAESKYSARPYDGTILVVCAGAPRNQAGWRTIGVTQFIELPTVNGEPGDTHLTDAAYVEAVAAALNKQLAT